MANQYATIHEWADQQRALVRRDFDNVVLFSGREGSGKSTWAIQVLRLLDPALTIDNIHFDQGEFMKDVANGQRFQGHLFDEVLMHKRKAMHGSTLAMLELLQVCRGLNRHIGLCFPDAEQLDRDLVDWRVRWNFHVIRRGIAMLRVRKSYTVNTRLGPKQVHKWHNVQAFSFSALSGPFKDAYEAKKEERMRGSDPTQQDGPLQMLQASGLDLRVFDEVLEELATIG